MQSLQLQLVRSGDLRTCMALFISLDLSGWTDYVVEKTLSVRKDHGSAGRRQEQ